MNKFTDNLQQVVSLAQESAKLYGSSYIGSEHIVFAMLNCPDCTAFKVLTSCGVSEPAYREYFARSIDRNSNIVGYTPRTKHMMERALELSIDINGDDSLAGTEHMLLSVMSSSDCLAMRILRALGVNVAKLSSKVELALTGGLSDMEEDDEEDPFKVFEGFFATSNSSNQKKKESKASPSLDKSILQYGSDLTQKAREGKVDPVI
ncbi:MAG: ATP-dependent Clp protease ATP-binding subunit, partial [Clostridia bacterium]|nr:ATP-dependent Clp protease ATP-binding subunit [Clostridia bacterium]